MLKCIKIHFYMCVILETKVEGIVRTHHAYMLHFSVPCEEHIVL